VGPRLGPDFIKKEKSFVCARFCTPDHPVCSPAIISEYAIPIPSFMCIYGVSQEECARLRESVPYVKLY